MALQDYNPSNTFPDLDGSGGQGPLQFPQDEDPYAYETHYIGSGGTANKHGLFGKILDGMLYLFRRQGRPTVKITASGQVLDRSMGYVFACAAPSVLSNVSLRDAISGGSPQPVDGQMMVISRPAGGAHNIVVNDGGIGVIATLPSATRATVVVQYMDLNEGSGLTWRVVGGFGFASDTLS